MQVRKRFSETAGKFLASQRPGCDLGLSYGARVESRKQQQNMRKFTTCKKGKNTKESLPLTMLVLPVQLFFHLQVYWPRRLSKYKTHHAVA